MKAMIQKGSRYLFGSTFLIFGLNGFFGFMPLPPVSPEAGALLGAFAKTGYFFPMIKLIEIIVGLLLVSNCFVPLALALIAPLLIGITSIHLFLNPAGLPLMIFLHGLHLLLVISYKNSYLSVLRFKVAPFEED
ncbi:MAG: hypothetical protein VW378_02745 [bacterium]